MRTFVTILCLFGILSINSWAMTPMATDIAQQDPQDETVADSVSIDDAAPIFYDAEEEMEEELAPEKESNPVNWAIYLGGAALVIIIIFVLIRRVKKDQDEQEE